MPSELASVPPNTTVEGRWSINQKHRAPCSGKLASYHLEYYNSSNVNGNGPYTATLAIWKRIGTHSYELVDGSTRTVSRSSLSNKRRRGTLSVDVDAFVYIPSGSVVGVYLPSSNYLPVIGFAIHGNMQYGLCVSASANGDETTEICSTTSFGLLYPVFPPNYRLHVTATIEMINNCGPLANISNGIVELVNDSTEYGSIAQYQCNQPLYTLEGNEYRYCTEDSTWNGTEPSCVVFSCTDPGSPVNGQSSNGDTFTYGSSISYTCNSGYYLTGDAIITCGINMTWNTTEPTECNPVSCGDPGLELANGFSTGTKFVFESVISFSCNTGYTLNGSIAIECLADKHWNDSIPSCERTRCSKPDSPVNGFQTHNSTYTYNSTVHFACNPGYTLSDQQSSITCLANGDWSGSTPMCLPVCEAPPIPENGNATELNSEQKYQFMTLLTYNCDNGYYLNGSSTTMCMANKQWSDEAPECLRVCNDFDLANGMKVPDQEPFIVGIIVQLVCDDGYKLMGADAIECLANGEWNSTVQECTAATTSIISSTISTSNSTSSSTSSTSSSTTTSSSTSPSSSSSLFTGSSNNAVTSTESRNIDNKPVTTSATNITFKPPSSSSTTSTTDDHSVEGSSIVHSTPLSISPNIVNLSSTVGSSPVIVYGVVAGIVMFVLVMIVVSLMVVCVVRKKSRSKKYIVNSRQGPTNPMINADLHGTSSGSSGTTIVSELEVCFVPVAPRYEEPVSSSRPQATIPEADNGSFMAEPDTNHDVHIDEESATVTYRQSRDISRSKNNWSLFDEGMYASYL